MYQHTGVLPLDNQSITFSINKRRHNCRKTEVHGTTWPQEFAGSYCLQAGQALKISSSARTRRLAHTRGSCEGHNQRQLVAAHNL